MRTDEFFRASGRIPSWAAAVSIYATIISSVTYLTIPAKAFATDWTYYPMLLTIPMVVPLVTRRYMPYFQRSGCSSAYELLERRFSPLTRWMASGLFCIYMVVRIALVLYLPALALSTVAGWSIVMCIVLVALPTMIYSAIGGLKAVIWADAIQGIILIGGAVLCLGILMFSMPEGPMQTFDLAINSPQGNKFSLGEFTGDLTTSTFWVCLIYGIFINLQNYGIDQNYVQRYHAAKTDKDAKFSALFGGYLFIPVSALFFLIGSALYSYYQSGVAQLPADIAAKPDYVFPYFIVNGLPVGLRGLLIASIFAAGMSTVSTSVTSAATIILTDYARPFFLKARKVKDQLMHHDPEVHHARHKKMELAVVRLSSVGVGLLGAVVAIAMLSVESIIDAWWTLSSIFSGGMLGLFLLGCISRKINRVAAFIGCICGVLVIAWISLAGLWNLPGIHLHEYLAIVLGTCTIFLVGFLLTYLFKGKQV